MQHALSAGRSCDCWFGEAPPRVHGFPACLGRFMLNVCMVLPSSLTVGPLRILSHPTTGKVTLVF